MHHKWMKQPFPFHLSNSLLMSFAGDERGVVRRPHQALRHRRGQAGGHEGRLRGSEEALQREDGRSQRGPQPSGPGGGGEPPAAETAGHAAEAERRRHPLSAAVLLVHKEVKPEMSQKPVHTDTQRLGSCKKSLMINSSRSELRCKLERNAKVKSAQCLKQS